MSETHATTPVFPPGRYGRRRDGKKRLALPIVFAVLVAVVVVALAVRSYQQFGDPAYDAQIVRWTNVTSSQVTLDFTVNVPAGGTAECSLRARDYDGYQVGTRMVTVRAAEGETLIRASEVVPTTAEAFIGDVLRCGPAS